MQFETKNIRNVAVAGHGATGKTTLVENLLFVGGHIEKPETVASGRTVSDFSPDEIEHKMSIHASLAHVAWKGHQVNLLDAPGAADFVGEATAAFRAAESAVLLVDAEAGVQIETIKLWRLLDQRDRPRIVFVNKMDKPRADFEAVLDGLRRHFKLRFVPVCIPLSDDKGYAGVIDLIHMKAYLRGGDGKPELLADIPSDWRERAQAAHQAMIDAAAEGDDELSEKYLDGAELSVDEAIRGLREDLAAHAVVPVFCGSGQGCSGVTALLDILNVIAPSPEGLHDWTHDADGNEIERPIDPRAPVSFFSFKTSLDQFAGKLSYVKVITGVVKADQELLNVREQKRERVGKLYRCQGKRLEEVPELAAGDIGVAAKLAFAHTNDSYADPSRPVEYQPLGLPRPVHHVAVSAANKKDEDKLGEFIVRVMEEDKTIHLAYNPETKETVLSGMGEMQVGLLLERLRRQAKVEVQARPPRVAYRETITAPAEAEYTHKKQSGGHGQYARVNLKIRPLPPGERFRFVNAVHGGSISKNYLVGVEKGVVDGMAEGSLAGFPVVDLEATVFDGKEHPVDSSDMAFQLAARGALKDCLAKAKPSLLEPIAALKVYVEERNLGDILSSITSKRGKVLSQNQLGGGIVEVNAEAPQSELLRYAVELRSMTSGTGSFELAIDHYAPLAGRLAEEVVKAAQTEKAAAEH